MCARRHRVRRIEDGGERRRERGEKFPVAVFRAYVYEMRVRADAHKSVGVQTPVYL